MTSAFGCNLDVITLACPADKFINVTRATYGQYITACAVECCAPKPTDCAESLEENMPVIWEGLTDLCNGEVSCTFQIQGSILESCVDPYLSEFMQVFYSCFPGKHYERNFVFRLQQCYC